MVSETDERCGTCRFWKDQGYDDPEGYRYGFCRLFPPRFHEAAPCVGRSREYPGALFPATDLDDWCGQWQAIRQPVYTWKKPVGGTITRQAIRQPAAAVDPEDQEWRDELWLRAVRRFAIRGEEAVRQHFQDQPAEWITTAAGSGREITLDDVLAEIKRRKAAKPDAGPC